MARVAWEELPGAVRSWAEGVLGAAVVAAESQSGGFSPGAACRLLLADGGSAFCKAVSGTANPDSPGMHRREAAIAAALPSEVSAPKFLGSYDDGEWVALLFAAVDGRMPARPWQVSELDLVLAAIRQLHERCTPSPVPDLPTIADRMGGMLTGWRSLAAAGSPGPDSADPGIAATLTAAGPWVRRHLDHLAELESAWSAAAAGDTLLHSDLRADNVLIGAGRVWLVDWPHACTGVPWFDVACMAPSVAMDGGPEPEWLMERTAPASRDALIAVVAALAGYFAHRATLPPPPGLPTLREFQERQAIPAVAWLRRLTGWR